MSPNCTAENYGNRTLENATSIYERHPGGYFLKEFVPVAFYLKLYAAPVWFIVGLIGNSMSFFIWASKRQRNKNSSAMYLAALAFSDFFLILLMFTDYLREFLFLYSPIGLEGICQLFQGFYLFFQYYSIALTFGFTLERWIAVCYPFKRHKLCSTRRAIIAVSIFALLIAVLNICYTLAWEVKNDECIFAERWQNETSFHVYLITNECIFSLLVPTATLVFNILVLKEMGTVMNPNSVKYQSPVYRGIPQSTLQKASDRKDVTWLVLRSRQSGHYTSEKDQTNFQAATLMLVILSFYLIVCTLPVGIVFLVQFHYRNTPEIISDEEVLKHSQWVQFFAFLQVKEILNFLCASHYAINFIIYILTGKSFRTQLLEIFSCRRNKSITILPLLARARLEASHFPR